MKTPLKKRASRLAHAPDCIELPTVPDAPWRLPIWFLPLSVLSLASVIFLAHWLGGALDKSLPEEATLVEVEAPPAPPIPPPPPPPPPPLPPEPKPVEPEKVSADPDQAETPPNESPAQEAQFGLSADALGASGDMAVATGNTLMKAPDAVVKKEPPPLAAGFDPQSVRSAYLNGLRQLLEQSKKYPSLARRLKQQGKVKIRFTILADGRIADARLAEGCPFDALNKGALETVTALSHYKPIPGELGLERWEVEIPISYRID